MARFDLLNTQRQVTGQDIAWLVTGVRYSYSYTFISLQLILHSIGMNGPVYNAPDTQTLRACLESCSADGNKCQGADWHKVSKKCAKKGKADWANSRQDSNYHAFYNVGWVKKA
jgi:hypothetical protein